MSTLIDGTLHAKAAREAVRQRIAKEKLALQLDIILIGDDKPSQVYVREKQKACAEAGVTCEVHKLDENAGQTAALKLIKTLNSNPKTTGILLQLPIPKNFDRSELLETLAAEKDVDGLTPVNTGRLFLGEEIIIPCTPKGVLELLEAYNIQLKGKHVAIVGAGILTGKPIAALLLNRGATVTLCNSHTPDLASHTKRADILISAVGKPGLITREMLKEGAVVIDIGITKQGNKVLGDVDFETAKERASFITPVPGGVGPMTVAMLLKNLLALHDASTADH